MPQTRPKIAIIVSPSGQAGGGMGRVKDYILQSGGDYLGRLRFVALDTRDQRGTLISILLTLRAVWVIWLTWVRGELAFVHVNMGDRGSAARKGFVVGMARLAGVPVVLHLHAVLLLDDHRRGGPLRRALIRMPFRLATCNIVLGQIWRRWLIDDLGVQPDKVEVVCNGVPVVPQAPSPLRKPGPVKLLFLGNLMERKGVTDLLTALTDMPQDLPPWQLTMAGGGDLEHYWGVIAEYKLGSRAALPGWVDQSEAQRLLADADLLVLPSYEEGLPLVILEALGSGTPVLCTPVGAIPEVLTDGVDAMFVSPGDQAALTARLAELIGDPALRGRLAESGLASYEAKFSLPAFLTALFGVYRRQLGVEVELRAVDPVMVAAQ
jgi:glycosyltransferase involved in cell wall biosynthesis